MKYKLHKSFVLVLTILLSFSLIVLPSCENSKNVKIAELESQLDELENKLNEAESQVVSLKLELSENEAVEEQTKDYNLTGEEVREIAMRLAGLSEEYFEEFSEEFILRQNDTGEWVVDNNSLSYLLVTKLDGELLQLTAVNRAPNDCLGSALNVQGFYVYNLTTKEFLFREHENVQNNTQKYLNDFPYSVPISEINNTTFYFIAGINTPDSVTISFNENNEGYVDFLMLSLDPNESDERVVFNATVRNIRTKEIRVFNANRTSHDNIRTVNVNTEIVLSNEDITYFKGNLYLFYNSQGGISLITPNYAGNVPPELSDVMLEITF